VLGDLLPEALMARVWERREAGHSAIDIALWLSRIGYLIRPDEVAVIASQYAQRRESGR
jgi:hypothetical protein